jgi:hypothetical protein
MRVIAARSIFSYHLSVKSKARAKRQMSFKKCSKNLLIRG